MDAASTAGSSLCEACKSRSSTCSDVSLARPMDSSGGLLTHWPRGKLTWHWFLTMVMMHVHVHRQRQLHLDDGFQACLSSDGAQHGVNRTLAYICRGGHG